jgi:hypothetical protein
VKTAKRNAQPESERGIWEMLLLCSSLGKHEKLEISDH